MIWCFLLFFSACLKTVRATYMDLYTIGCTIESPFIWYIQKYMFIWKLYFCFRFVFAICSSKMKTRHVTRDLSTGKVLSRWDNFHSCDPFTYNNWTESTFPVSRSRVTWLILIFDEQIMKKKFKFSISTCTFIYIPNDGGLNCVSEGV